MPVSTLNMLNIGGDFSYEQSIYRQKKTQYASKNKTFNNAHFEPWYNIESLWYNF